MKDDPTKNYNKRYDFFDIYKKPNKLHSPVSNLSTNLSSTTLSVSKTINNSVVMKNENKPNILEKSTNILDDISMKCDRDSNNNVNFEQNNIIQKMRPLKNLHDDYGGININHVGLAHKNFLSEENSFFKKKLSENDISKKINNIETKLETYFENPHKNISRENEILKNTGKMYENEISNIYSKLDVSFPDKITNTEGSIHDFEEDMIIQRSHIYTKPIKNVKPKHEKNTSIVRKAKKQTLDIYFANQFNLKYKKAEWIKKFPQLNFKTEEFKLNSNFSRLYNISLESIKEENQIDTCTRKISFIIEQSIDEFTESFVKNKLGHLLINRINFLYGFVKEITKIFIQKFPFISMNEIIDNIENKMQHESSIGRIFYLGNTKIENDYTFESLFIRRLYEKCLSAQSKSYKIQIKNTNELGFKKLQKFASNMSFISLRNTGFDSIIVINQIILFFRGKSIFLDKIFTKYQKKYLLNEVNYLQHYFIIYKNNEIEVICEKLLNIFALGFSKINKFSSVLFEIFGLKAGKYYRKILNRQLHIINESIRNDVDMNKVDKKYEMFINEALEYLVKKNASKDSKHLPILLVRKYHRLFMFTCEFIEFIQRIMFYLCLDKKMFQLLEYEKLEDKYLFLRDFIGVCEIDIRNK